MKHKNMYFQIENHVIWAYQRLSYNYVILDLSIRGQFKVRYNNYNKMRRIREEIKMKVS